MAFKYKIYTDINLVAMYNFGQMELREGKLQIEEILADPAYQVGMNFLRDTTAAKLPPEWGFDFFHNQTPPQIRALWQQLGECKLAWVAKDSSHYKIAHQAMISNRLSSTDKIDRQPFSTLEEAKSWLGIPDDYEIIAPSPDTA